MSTAPRLLLLLATAASGASCSTAFPVLTEALDQGLRRQLDQQAVTLASAEKIRLRAILTVAGMELPLTVLILRRTPGDLRVNGMQDLGGTTFHFVSNDAAANTRIVQANPALDPRLLSQGLARDFAMWLFPGARADDQAVRHPAGIGLLRRDGNRQLLRWRSGQRGPFDRLARGRDGRLDAEAWIEWRDQRPTHIRIENHQFDYQLELWPNSWQPAELQDRHFH